MIISLDFDGTFTAAPELWEQFIKSFKEAGHSVICVTMRYPEEGQPVETMIGKLVDKIYYTSRKNKATYMHALGIYVNIWIDDQPHFIFQDASS